MQISFLRVALFLKDQSQGQKDTPTKDEMTNYAYYFKYFDTTGDGHLSQRELAEYDFFLKILEDNNDVDCNYFFGFSPLFQLPESESVTSVVILKQYKPSY